MQAGAQKAVAIAGAVEAAVPTQLLLRSVGYKSLPIAGLPWDERRGVVPMDEAEVVAATGGDGADGAAAGPGTATGSSFAGLYASGWLRHGSSGVISTNKTDAEQVVSALLAD